ncbi:MAG: hydroxymyristoyl-ACP dehydratase [Burkholderiaceae bacterium]
MLGAPLAHTEIARLIPHQGAMCLLAGVAQWDAESITCQARNHRDLAHPLRSSSGLLSTCLIEYAAQAMALHGALRVGEPMRPGFLAAARDVQFTRLRLDDLPPASPDELGIIATCRAADARQLLYDFSAFHAGALLASGRISVALTAQE